MALKPINTSKSQYSKSFLDIAVSFARNPLTNDCGKVLNENAIKQSLKNLILTRKGERPFAPDLGSDVYASLFEQLDAFTLNSIEDEIRQTIRNFESRIIVTNLDLIPNYEENSIQVNLEYQIVGENISYEIDFILARDF